MQLLKKKPIERLGTGKRGYDRVKGHIWLNGVDFNDVLAKGVD